MYTCTPFYARAYMHVYVRTYMHIDPRLTVLIVSQENSSTLRVWNEVLEFSKVSLTIAKATFRSVEMQTVHFPSNIHIHIHIHAHAHTQTCTHPNMHTPKHAHTQTYTHPNMHTPKHVHEYMSSIVYADIAQQYRRWQNGVWTMCNVCKCEALFWAPSSKQPGSVVVE